MMHIKPSGCVWKSDMVEPEWEVTITWNHLGAQIVAHQEANDSGGL